MQCQSDELERRRRRAHYRANHRGTKEMDLILGRFVEAAICAMSEAELELFEQLLCISDPELHAWLLDPTLSKQSTFADLLEEIRRFHGIGAERAADARR